ncbi:MAG: helix-turn-helix transcriptional regulator [Gammaproteobacteria bacterium]|nr:helix-turn-helix transcriptional regulator [Gammaproteobacteria bacterium]MDD9815920.1 helix-turn-helix transcriptional regulator [Gammaproteobacteria bacterium]MDD9870842.1 helix-turn-helix transcriptional regulator [Gammaproteobacteria bacterium]
MPNKIQSLAGQFQLILGQRIKSRRRELAHTQLELSSTVDISRTALANIETGQQRTSVFLLVRLARALEIPPGDLIPELSEAEQRLQRSRSASIPVAGKAELLTGELQKLNISVESSGLDSVLKEVQSQHKKSSSSSKRRSSP